MKYLPPFFVCICLGLSSIAQPSIQWQKTLGGSESDRGRDILQTPDGGYIMAGRTSSSDGDVANPIGVLDVWIVKLNALGTIEWEKTLGGSNHEQAYAIQTTTDGGYILAGTTESDDGDVTGHHGKIDGWVVKLRNTGEIDWQRSLGGGENDEFWSVRQTIDGGYILAGMSESMDGDVIGNHGGSLDYWVVKLTASGDMVWQKCLGGNSDDYATSIRQMSDGTYMVTGQAKSMDGDVTGNNGNVDMWIVKLRETGEIDWQKAIGGAGLDAGTDIQEISDGYLACGYAGSSTIPGFQGWFDFWVIKLKKTGEIVWQKTFGGTEPDYVRAMVQTSDGNIVVAGETKSQNGDVTGNNGIQVVWVVKLNQSGDMIWQKTFGGSDGEGAFSIQQTSDNGFVFAGYTWSNDGDVSGNHGKSDVWVVKLSSDLVSSQEAPNPVFPSLNIFPNPATNFVHLTTETAATILQVRIIDIQGREVLRQLVLAGSSLDVSGLASGTYQVFAEADGGEVFTGKLRKE